MKILPMNILSMIVLPMRVVSHSFVTAPVLILVLGLSCVACSSGDIPRVEGVDYQVIGQDPEQPEGVERYCWEEPLVELEKQSPGVKDEGRWYAPSATIGRQVRQGKWRPCVVKRSKYEEMQ